MTDWRTATNKQIAENLLDKIALLMDGKWHRSSTLDYTGKQTTKYTIEFNTPEPDEQSPSL
mgnify:CR=1 FL=1|jgi:hypothetical protein|tara:strand:+ start:39 stop:221 length:183 start_codon:yes stop_codon:yes gene_type:complete